MSRPALRGEAGETLVESLVSTAILGIAVVAVLGAVFMGVHLSGDHRNATRADVAVKAAAQQIKSLPYTDGASTYAASAAGHTLSITVRCLPATAAAQYDLSIGPLNCSVTDSGLQVVTVTAKPSGGGAAETVRLMKRRP